MVKGMISIVALWRRFLADRRGISALEAAIALPVLALALAGTLEFGINIYNRQQLQAAVQAGVQYALYNPTDTAGVQSTIAAALPADVGVSVSTPSYVCECNDGTTIACNPLGTCAVGSPRKIMTMSVTRPPVQLVSYLIGLRPTILRASGAVNVPAS
jgi:Flp pilus assembly protein TadG